MIQVLFAERLRRARTGWRRRVRGLDALRARVAPLAPERVAGRDRRRPAEITRTLARELAAARSAVVYGRVGVSMHPVRRAVPLAGQRARRPHRQPRSRAAVRCSPSPRSTSSRPAACSGSAAAASVAGARRCAGCPSSAASCPVATLAEDIEAGGEAPIRALLTIAGNPVLSTPNGARLERAIGVARLRGGDRLLPQRDHAPCPRACCRRRARSSTPTTTSRSTRSRCATPRSTARRRSRSARTSATTHRIIAGLERRLHDLRGAPLHARAEVRARERLGPEGIVALGLRVGPWGLRRGPWGAVARASSSARRTASISARSTPCLPDRLPRAPRRQRAAHRPRARRSSSPSSRRCRAELGDAARDGFVLIGRRQLRSNNSWMHNVPKLMTGKPRCTLLVHPDDAARLGVQRRAVGADLLARRQRDRAGRARPTA